MASNRLMTIVEDAPEKVGALVTSTREISQKFQSITPEMNIKKILLFLIIIFPSAMFIAYAILTPSRFYESETQFSVQSKRPQSALSGISSMMASLGMGSGGGGEIDLFAVRRYLHSPDALEEIERTVGFKSRYGYSKGGMILGLPDGSRQSSVLSFYRNVVTVRLSVNESIFSVNVWAFTPEDAHILSKKILEISENFINKLNIRAQGDNMKFREVELAKSEARILAARLAINAWRNENGALDPRARGEMIQGVITSLESELARIRSDLQELRSDKNVERFQPRINSLLGREETLKLRIAEEYKRIGGQGSTTVSAQLLQFERLQLESDFAQKSYEAAVLSLEAARQEANIQQKYIVTITEPKASPDHVFPRLYLHSAILIFVLFMVYFLIIMFLNIFSDYRY